MASDEWIHELTSHSYISSKIICLTFLEKPGKAIYLMKQRSRLIRAKRDSKKYPVTRRISDGKEVHLEEEKEI